MVELLAANAAAYHKDRMRHEDVSYICGARMLLGVSAETQCARAAAG